MIGIIDYHAGNPVSVLNMLTKAGADAFISSDTNQLAKASKFILPGVGTFSHAMEHLRECGIDTFLHQKICVEKMPVLGICLGMQLMTANSAEGAGRGLGWIDAETIKFNFSDHSIKVPHVGWNTVKIHRNSKLFEGIEENATFYFIHSYHLPYIATESILGTTCYHSSFTSVIEAGNIIGIQFHPEKSHSNGLRLLKNFALHY